MLRLFDATPHVLPFWGMVVRLCFVDIVYLVTPQRLYWRFISPSNAQTCMNLRAFLMASPCPHTGAPQGTTGLVALNDHHFQLQNQLQNQVLKQQGHHWGVKCVAFSPGAVNLKRGKAGHHDVTVGVDWLMILLLYSLFC